VNGMWMPVSFDAIATVRFLGQYTLTGLNLSAADLSATTPRFGRATAVQAWLVHFALRMSKQKRDPDDSIAMRSDAARKDERDTLGSG